MGKDIAWKLGRIMHPGGACIAPVEDGWNKGAVASGRKLLQTVGNTHGFHAGGFESLGLR